MSFVSLVDRPGGVARPGPWHVVGRGEVLTAEEGVAGAGPSGQGPRRRVGAGRRRWVRRVQLRPRPAPESIHSAVVVGGGARDGGDRRRRPIARVLAAVGVVALAGLAAGGCGVGGTGGNSQADQAFLAELHGSAPDIGSYRSDVALTRLGHAACDGFSAGASYQQLADRLVVAEGAHPLPSEDLGAVISAAAANYCPRYRDLVG